MKKIILNNSIWLLSNNLLQILIGFYTFYLLANNLTKEVFGEITYSLSVIAISKVLVDLGLEKIIIRKQLDALNNFKELNNYFVVRIIISILVFLGIIIFLFFGKIHNNTQVVLPIYVGILFTPVNTFVAYFKAIDKNKFVFISNIFSQIVLLATIILVFNLKLSIVFIGLSYLLQIIIFALIVINYLRKTNYSAFSYTNTINFRFKENLPFILLGLSSIINEKLDHIIVGSYLGFEELSSYSISSKITETFKILPAVIGSTTFPSLYKLKSSSNLLNFKSSFFIVSIGLVTSIVIVLLAQNQSQNFIKVLFNENYNDVPFILNIMIYSIVPYYCFFMLTQIFYLYKIENILAITSIITIILSTLIVAYLTKNYGIKGASFSRIINSLIPYLFMGFILIKYNRHHAK